MLGWDGGSQRLLERVRSRSPKGVHSRAVLRVRGASGRVLDQRSSPPEWQQKRTRAANERMDKERMDNDKERFTLMGIRAPCCLSPYFAWTACGRLVQSSPCVSGCRAFSDVLDVLLRALCSCPTVSVHQCVRIHQAMIRAHAPQETWERTEGTRWSAASATADGTLLHEEQHNDSKKGE